MFCKLGNPGLHSSIYCTRGSNPTTALTCTLTLGPGSEGQNVLPGVLLPHQLCHYQRQSSPVAAMRQDASMTGVRSVLEPATSARPSISACILTWDSTALHYR